MPEIEDEEPAEELIEESSPKPQKVFTEADFAADMIRSQVNPN